VSAPSPRRLAAIDLGTNTVRVLVVEAAGQTWRPLHQAQRVTRLGAGQAAAGRLLDDPMRRTVDTVAEFTAAALRLGAGAVHIVATSAVREAPNRDELVARVRAATGRTIEVLSGEDEARLMLLGVANGLPALAGPCVVADIGGGSTEVVRAEAGRLVGAVSMKLGVVQLGERFMGVGPVDRACLALLRREIDQCLADELPAALAAAPVAMLVGTAGTVTTLAALDLGLDAYDAGRVQGHVVACAATERLLARLAGMTLAERAALPCLEPGRADVLIPGIAICLALMARLGQESLVVSDHGLREGLVHRLVRAF
jgi:exopolyphosphatase / guanosine-5'-triphosphate,3'-diphosphate pyrophosphatase